MASPSTTSTPSSTPLSTPSTTPAPTINSSIFSSAMWTWKDKDMRDVFPSITDTAWSNLKSKQIDEFVRAHVVGTSWMQSWDHSAVAASKVFREFVEKVSKECVWLTVLKGTERSQLLCKMAQNGVQRVRDRDTSRKKARNDRLKRKKVELEDDDGGETARRGESETVVEMSVKEENMVVSDFVSVDALAEETVQATSVHLRLSRRLGGIYGTLSYQTQLAALARQSHTTSNEHVFKQLSFEKLDNAAKLYLGFNVKDELLAIDYGTKQEPEWLFIQDDASFRSTIKTWHMQHPKTVIVEVLLFDRPGFIPYRTAKDLKRSRTEDSEEEDEDELDSDDDEDGTGDLEMREDDGKEKEMEEEDTTGGSVEKQQEVGDDKKSDGK